MFYPDAAKLPYVADWTFDIQYAPGKNWLLDIAYVGNAGNKLTDSMVNPNQVNPTYLSLGNLLNQPINSPAVVAAGFKLPYPNFVQSFPNTPTLAQALRPFPQYAGINLGPNNGPGISGSANTGHSTYHALQWKVQKQLSQGLFLLTAFTWSKKITNADSGWGGFNSTSTRDAFNRGLEKAISPSNPPRRLTSAFTYELPFGPRTIASLPVQEE